MTRQLSDQELRLWLRVARTVKTTNPTASHQSGLEREPTSPRAAAVTGIPSTSATPTAARPVVRPAEDQSRHRRIRRGQVEIDATIDLHGYNQEAAQRALVEFVHAERMSGARCLLVITGKGRAGTGVLRRRFLDWINQPDIRPHVSGYSAASARHGGDGAFYLLLKRNIRS